MSCSNDRATIGSYTILLLQSSSSRALHDISITAMGTLRLDVNAPLHSIVTRVVLGTYKAWSTSVGALFPVSRKAYVDHPFIVTGTTNGFWAHSFVRRPTSFMQALFSTSNALTCTEFVYGGTHAKHGTFGGWKTPHCFVRTLSRSMFNTVASITV